MEYVNKSYCQNREANNNLTKSSTRINTILGFFLVAEYACGQQKTFANNCSTKMATNK